MHSGWVWVGFNAVVIFLLLVDLVVFHKKDHEIKIQEAVNWSIFWIALALVFNVLVWHFYGTELALQFFTGYLLEKSLSVDNLFVFILIFSYFQVPSKYEHKILFWGILGAIVMRAVFIFCGISLIHRFEWLLYVLGAILVVSGVKLFKEEEKEIHPEKNPVLNLLKKIVPITHDHRDGKFFVREKGRLAATSLFVVLVMVETTDVIFAMDSIPAILAISRDSFIVYSSNIFAILGLRALYFALAGMMKSFRFLHYGLGLILVFIGIKMLVSGFYHFPIQIALGVIFVILGGSIGASIWFPKKTS